MTDFYAEMTSRNWAFLSAAQQDQVRETRLLLAGCGLASVVAVLAAQTGFTRFTLVDHDDVEVSNLNRQAFDRSHIGINKARALASILKARNDSVQVEALEYAITVESAEYLVARADIVVNTVDFDEVTFALNDAAARAGKPVLFPMNIGWGGFCLVFTTESATLTDMVGPDAPTSDADFIGRILGHAEDFALPSYLATRLRELPDIVDSTDRAAPQLAVAAARSASLVVEAATRLALGLPVRTAPRPMYLDTWDDWAG